MLPRGGMHGVHVVGCERGAGVRVAVFNGCAAPRFSDENRHVPLLGGGKEVFEHAMRIPSARFGARHIDHWVVKMRRESNMLTIRTMNHRLARDRKSVGQG